MSAPEASSGRIARETERLKMALDAADSVVIGAGRDLTSGGCIIRRGTMGFSRARFRRADRLGRRMRTRRRFVKWSWPGDSRSPRTVR